MTDSNTKSIQKTANAVGVVADCITYVKEQAAFEGESVSPRSIETLLYFMRIRPATQPGNLFLRENGNLRVSWKGDGESRVGLEFLSNGFIQYVLFKLRHEDLPVSRAYGRDTPDGVCALISALELDRVMLR